MELVASGNEPLFHAICTNRKGDMEAVIPATYACIDLASKLLFTPIVSFVLLLEEERVPSQKY